MSQFKCNLNHVRVAAPCNVDWDSMFGDDRKRFCGQCKLNVYNLSEMTRSEAELLVARSEGRLCVRYYRRRDGSIITQNCPVGLRVIKRRLSRVASAIGSAVLTFFAGIGAYSVAARFSLVSVPYQGGVMGVMAIPDKGLPISPPTEMGEMALDEKPVIEQIKKSRTPKRRKATQSK